MNAFVTLWILKSCCKSHFTAEGMLPATHINDLGRAQKTKTTYRLRTAWTDINSAGTLNVSKNISAAFSRFLRGFNGASVSNTGCWNRVHMG